MTVYIFIFSTKNHILRTFLRQISFSGIPSKSERFLAINIIKLERFLCFSATNLHHLHHLRWLFRIIKLLTNQSYICKKGEVVVEVSFVRKQNRFSRAKNDSLSRFLNPNLLSNACNLKITWLLLSNNNIFECTASTFFDLPLLSGLFFS